MLLKNRMAIHCDTKEKAKAFIEECYNQGFICGEIKIHMKILFGSIIKNTLCII